MENENQPWESPRAKVEREKRQKRINAHLAFAAVMKMEDDGIIDREQALAVLNLRVDEVVDCPADAWQHARLQRAGGGEET